MTNLTVPWCVHGLFPQAMVKGLTHDIYYRHNQAHHG